MLEKTYKYMCEYDLYKMLCNIDIFKNKKKRKGYLCYIKRRTENIKWAAGLGCQDLRQYTCIILNTM